MTFDTTSPSFIVSVISVRPEIRIQGTNDPNALGQVLDRMTDLSERVVSFTFEDHEKKHDVLKLVVDNHDLYFFDHPAWVKGNLVRFRFGYPGRIFGPRLAVIDSVRGFLKLTITCTEQTSMSNTAQCRTFTNKTRVEVVRELVALGAFQVAQSTLPFEVHSVAVCCGSQVLTATGPPRAKPCKRDMRRHLASRTRPRMD